MMLYQQFGESNSRASGMPSTTCPFTNYGNDICYAPLRLIPMNQTVWRRPSLLTGGSLGLQLEVRVEALTSISSINSTGPDVVLRLCYVVLLHEPPTKST